MERNAQLSALLRELRSFGVAELFLDGLTAEDALRLATAGGAASPAPTRTATEAAVDTTATPAPAATPDRASPEEAPVARPAAAGLEVLSADAAGCTRCRLSETRTQVVFGRGSGRARVVVVGEAPGGEEDRRGLPFVGPAGKLLDLLLLSIGLDRESVYICNVIKCRPPNNRDPRADEVAQCAPWLHGQLEAIRPAVLLAVGRFAAQMLTGTETGIGRVRGRVHRYRDVPVIATYHPAYLLRSPEATRKTWQDFQLMRQVLDESS